MLVAVEEELQKAIPLRRAELGRKAEKCAYNGLKGSRAVCKMRQAGGKKWEVENHLWNTKERNLYSETK